MREHKKDTDQFFYCIIFLRSAAKVIAILIASC